MAIKKKVAISPAHYGITKIDNPIDGIWSETESNLLFALFLTRELEEADIKTFFMGYGTYKERKLFANAKKVNLYISIHTDAIDSDAIVAYRSGDESSYKIASYIVQTLRKLDYPIPIKIVERKTERADRDNLSGLHVPGIIIMPYSIKKHISLFRREAYKMSSMWAYAIAKYYYSSLKKQINRRIL